MNGKWSCKPETGVIFDENGTVIGVADKSSALSIVAMHNRTIDTILRPNTSFFPEGHPNPFETVRGNRGFRNDFLTVDEVFDWRINDEG